MTSFSAPTTARLEALALRVRHLCVKMTSLAQSGHLTSSLSATDLMVGLMFGGTFRFNTLCPDHPNNDRLLFSKGHASPLFYALWTVAGTVEESELDSYRRLGSKLEGHPTPHFPYADAATGSLGQGLGIGLGMALNAQRLDRLNFKTYVLLGDSEMAEGSQWEAIQLAAFYKVSNLVGIIDVNRLGQSRETMVGANLDAYVQRVRAFGWKAIPIDGHNYDQILKAYREAAAETERPSMIIAATIKGKGISFLEDKDGWHGKALKKEEQAKAEQELSLADPSASGEIAMPDANTPNVIESGETESPHYRLGEKIATRVAYGNALNRLADKFPQLVALDGEVSNSTMSDLFAKKHPERYFEMFIAEQNMVEVALGISLYGKVPFVSTFAAFFSRAFDQIRMSQYSRANIKFVGSHAGVSIGEDGPSQMGLEDIAMFRSVLNSVVLHPCDAVSTDRLVESAATTDGIVYLRTLRQGTPVIYENAEDFPIGSSKVLRHSPHDHVTLVAAGATVHEALAAYELLLSDGVYVRVIDAYSIKPIDTATLRQAATHTGIIVTVEDHFPAGGLADAVQSALASDPVPVISLAVRTIPGSATPEEQREAAGISTNHIVKTVRDLLAVRESQSLASGHR
ncbi:MAG: transketolase [Nibricoccus sp.]